MRRRAAPARRARVRACCLRARALSPSLVPLPVLTPVTSMGKAGGGMRLTEAELVTFREEGFVIKYNALDPELMARARDLLWESAPPSLRRNDPSTWVGPIKKEDDDE